MRVFIADDEAGFRRVVVRVAEERGWQAVECANGRELLSAFTTGAGPDLIILDMMMPEMDGIETVWRIHDMNAAVPVCIVTGGPAVQSMAARLIGEANDLNIKKTLIKPVPLVQLIALFQAAEAGFD